MSVSEMKQLYESVENLRRSNAAFAASLGQVDAEITRLRAVIIWARDRINVDSKMTKAEAERTCLELLMALKGLPSDASIYDPEPWQSPTLAALTAYKEAEE